MIIHAVTARRCFSRGKSPFGVGALAAASTGIATSTVHRAGKHLLRNKNPLQIILFYRHEGRSPLAKLLTVLPLFASYEILPTHEEGGRKSLGGGFRPQV